MSSTTDCPLCGGSDTYRKYKGHRYVTDLSIFDYAASGLTNQRPVIHQCRECGHVFQDPKLWPADLINVYSEVSDPTYESMEEIKRRTFRRAVNRVIGGSSSRLRVLEVGAYNGLFGEEISHFDVDYQGTELSGWALRSAKRRGLSVTQVAVENLTQEFELNSFDITVAWDVLEHVKDPRLALQNISQVTRKNGFVYISTLDRGNWFPRLLGPYWPWYIPMHLHYFDQSGIAAISRDTGLSVLESWPHVHYTHIQYLWSQLRSSTETQTFSPKFLGTLTNRAFPVGFGDVRAYKLVKSRD